MKRAVAGTFATQVAGIFFNLATSVLTARAFLPGGKADVAIYSLGLAAVVGVFSLGSSSAAVYFRSKRSVGDVTLMAIFGLQASIAIAALLVMNGLRSVHLMSFLLPEHNQAFFRVVAVFGILGYFVSEFSVSMCLSEGRFREVNIVRSINLVISLGCAVGVLVTRLTPDAAVRWFVAVTVAGSFLTFLALPTVARFKWRWRVEQAEPTGRILLYGLKSSLADLVQLLSYRADIWVVSYYLGRSEVGRYVLAVGIGQILWALPGAISSVVFPRTSAGQLEFNVVLRLGRVTTTVLSIAALALAVVMPFAVPMVWGPQFAGSAIALVWLLPGIVALGTAKIYAGYLAGHGRMAENLVGSALGAMTGLGVDILIVPMFGIAGAAVGCSIGYIATAGYTAWRLSQGTRIDWPMLLLWDVREVANLARGELAKWRPAS